MNAAIVTLIATTSLAACEVTFEDPHVCIPDCFGCTGWLWTLSGDPVLDVDGSQRECFVKED